MVCHQYSISSNRQESPGRPRAAPWEAHDILPRRGHCKGYLSSPTSKKTVTGLFKELITMESETLRQRKPIPGARPVAKEKVQEEHPGGDAKYGGPKQVLRLLLIMAYWLATCSS